MKILAVTSGKGGVGKTTLSVNIAKQLSLSGVRTILVDLDIHNKGATSLFLDKVEEATAKTDGKSFMGLLAASRSNSSDDHRDVQPIICPLDPDKMLLFLPATKAQELIEWKALHGSNAELTSFLSSMLSALSSKFEREVVILDCYGGIDSLTIAAVGVASNTIIVNEPDLITFSGTLLLYSYISETYKNSPTTPHIHFLINRITSRHSFEFLEREYRKNLAPLASDDRILAYLPFDRLIMETFGDYPFFTELLPNSLISKKLRLALWSL
jgi:cellulose biosynthesis protein BcsQ